MTDFELNKAIAALVYPYRTLGFPNIETGEIYVGSASVDYCNNWSDLMPLVVEHRVEWRELPPSIWWHAFHARSGYEGKNENPQRALAECLYKVLKDKDEVRQLKHLVNHNQRG